MSFNNSVNFKVGLLHNIFDDTNNNVRLYNNKNDRDTNIENLVEIWQEDLVNIPFGDNINFNLKLNLSSISEEKISKILNYNYCIIKNVNTFENFFYFVNSSQITSSMIILNLTIDHIQTYLYDVEFPLSLIEQAHLDRWVQDPDIIENYKFNNKIDSKLFNNINLQEKQKFLKKREIITPFFGDLPDFNNILDNINWVYIYINPNWKPNDSLLPHFYNNYRGLTQGYNVIFAPLYIDDDSTKKLYIYDENNELYEWNIISFLRHIYDSPTQKLGANILNIKVSPISPFNNFVANINWEYRGEKIVILNPIGTQSKNNYIYYNINFDITHEPTMFLFFPPIEPSYFIVEDDTKFSFSESEIKNKDNIFILEPILNDKTLIELKISDFAGNNYSYNYQKIGKNKFKILFTASINLDIQKEYSRYEGEDNTLYEKVSNKSYIGLVTSVDVSIPFDIPQIQAFLAQNKNFYLQRGISIFSDLLHGNILSGVNNFLQRDNLLHAPDTIQKSNGNYLFNTQINNGLHYFIEYYNPIDVQKENVFWLLYMFGYTFNNIDNIKNYISTRKVFNYVKAQVSAITGEVSSKIKDMFKESFQNGIRFWHQDTIDYTLSNYERYIDTNLIYFKNTDGQFHVEGTIEMDEFTLKNTDGQLDFEVTDNE